MYKVTLTFTNANASEYAVIMKVPTSAKLGKLQEDLSVQMKDGVSDQQQGGNEVLRQNDFSTPLLNLTEGGGTEFKNYGARL